MFDELTAVSPDIARQVAESRQTTALVGDASLTALVLGIPRRSGRLQQRNASDCDDTDNSRYLSWSHCLSLLYWVCAVSSSDSWFSSLPPINVAPKSIQRISVSSSSLLSPFVEG